MLIEDRMIKMRTPDNWHAHFRQDQLMYFMVRALIESGFRARVVAMPNTTPPLLTGTDARSYWQSILDIARTIPGSDSFNPVAVMQITESTTPEMIREAVRLGVRAGKVYPRNVTTNSENGVADYTKLFPVLEEAERLDVVIQLHGEHPNPQHEGLNKEAAFLAIVGLLTLKFPRLRIVLEHISTRNAVDYVRFSPATLKIAATITPHHLLTTIDDVLGYSEESRFKMNVHAGCKPQPKFRSDMFALQDAAMSGNPRFFYGGDDAPHYRQNKECAGACGVFNTTVALSRLIQLFSERGKLLNLEPFLSQFGAEFYGYPVLDRDSHSVTLVREKWTVPNEYIVAGTHASGIYPHTVVPMFAGRELEWKVT